MIDIDMRKRTEPRKGVSTHAGNGPLTHQPGFGACRPPSYTDAEASGGNLVTFLRATGKKNQWRQVQRRRHGSPISLTVIAMPGCTVERACT
jgi:hypothetical protein